MKFQPSSFLIFFRKNFSFLLLLVSLFLFTGSITSCRSNKQQDQASEQQGKKKKKAKKCPDPTCKVRMSHYHEGSKFKGKRGNFFIRLFTPKESKYGQGRHRNHGWKSGKK